MLRAQRTCRPDHGNKCARFKICWLVGKQKSASRTEWIVSRATGVIVVGSPRRLSSIAADQKNKFHSKPASGVITITEERAAASELDVLPSLDTRRGGLKSVLLGRSVAVKGKSEPIRPPISPSPSSRPSARPLPRASFPMPGIRAIQDQESARLGCDHTLTLLPTWKGRLIELAPCSKSIGSRKSSSHGHDRFGKQRKSCSGSSE